ncbi:MAG: response regulator [bacterium]
MRPARVFLAEDDGDHIMLLRRALGRYPRPIELTIARDGQQAIEILARGEPPDLVLLDINMPRRTGFEVLEALRADPRLAPVPAAMLTTSARAEDREQSAALGADAFVTKPTSFRAFTDALFALLDRHLG